LIAHGAVRGKGQHARAIAPAPARL